MTQYCYSLDGTNFMGRFDSLEEAKSNCVTDHNLQDGVIYHVAEIKDYNPRDFMGVWDIMGKMNQQASAEVGSQKVGVWPDVSPSKYHELREMLADFFEKNYPVEFFKEENIKDFIAGTEDSSDIL